jgi:hypothetical protein
VVVGLDGGDGDNWNDFELRNCLLLSALDRRIFDKCTDIFDCYII